MTANYVYNDTKKISINSYIEYKFQWYMGKYPTDNRTGPTTFRRLLVQLMGSGHKAQLEG